MPIHSLRSWFRKTLARPAAPAGRRPPRLDALEERVNPADPYLVADVNVLPTKEGSSPTTAVDINGTAYFVATDPVHGAELWKSDGTAVGTVMVEDIRPGYLGANVRQLTVANGTLYFTAAAGGSTEGL